MATLPSTLLKMVTPEQELLSLLVYQSVLLLELES